MPHQNLYQYESARQFLLDFVEERKSADSGFSVRKWAQEMGMKSHTLLVMILQGKRTLRLDHISYFARGMKLTTPERLYFQSLIQLDLARSDEERDLCRVWLSDLRPAGALRVREIEEYRIIADWIHMAILAMTDLKDFSGSAEEIQARLGDRTSVHEVRAALERLFSLGLLKREDGRLRSSFDRVTTRDDVANRGAREYHKQVSRLAVDAVDHQSVEEREFQSLALSIPKQKLPLAKELIRKFRTQFCEAVGSESGDDVYQMNLQFFRLTESPSALARGRKVDAGAGAEAKPRTGSMNHV